MRRVGVVLLVVGAAVVVGGVAAFAVDTALTNGEAARNVSLGGRAIGALGPAQVQNVVEELADELERGTVTVATPAGDISLTSEEIDLQVDRAATAHAALHTGRQGVWPLRPLRWARSFVNDFDAPIVLSFDDETVTHLVASRDPSERAEPVEPSLAVQDGEIVATAPVNGRGLDGRAIVQELHVAAARGHVPLRVDAAPVALVPRFTLADAQPVAEHAAAITEHPITGRAGTVTGTITPATLRRALRLAPLGDRLLLAFDWPTLRGLLAGALPDAGTPPEDAGFRVVGDRVEITPAATGTTCCGQAAADLLLAALEAGRDAVDLPLRVAQPARTAADARALRIVEPVSTFTTPHHCCEPRVTNIHRIADIVRGVVIEPGQVFSLNGFVGERTVEKGFVSAPVIYKGLHDEDIGGGVSQFATTLFNAAFFGGLDFVEYQSHSLYISRYPYGREATVSWPKPDLRIRNATPHGILLWPTYTETSLTVTLWSTTSVEVEQTGQTQGRRGRCTRVTTTRSRHWLADDRTEVDHVYATYRPGEGISC